MTDDSLRADREEGEYWEEVEKITDSLISAAADGELTGHNAVLARLETAVAQSAYTNNDELCIHVLKYSKHPTNYFFTHGANSAHDRDFWLYDVAGLAPPKSYGRPVQRWNAGEKPFPWQLFAVEAMEADCEEALLTDKLYRNLNLPGAEDEDDGEEAADGEEETGEGDA